MNKWVIYIAFGYFVVFIFSSLSSSSPHPLLILSFPDKCFLYVVLYFCLFLFHCISINYKQDVGVISEASRGNVGGNPRSIPHKKAVNRRYWIYRFIIGEFN